MANLIQLDYNYVMAEVLGKGYGITSSEIDSLSGVAKKTSIVIGDKRSKGALPFFDIPTLKGCLKDIEEVAAGIRENFKTLVVLGIGGSALGARAIQEALVNPFDRSGVKVIIVDNIDPSYMVMLIDSLDLEKTAFNVISKSGGTIETLAQYMIIKGLITEKLGEKNFKERVVFTTDPEHGVLRQISKEEGIMALDVPPGIGGRFSVLSPVGLLPASVMGVDIEKLMNGAEAYDESTRDSGWDENPAYIYGLISYIASIIKGKNISVMMPYSSMLSAFAQWFAQLWAESLGKVRDIDGERRGVGQTPVVAIGATDQHSQLQLYAEGPDDKVITFIRVKEPTGDIMIPDLYKELDPLSSLGGKLLGELFDVERRATEAALAYKGRMSMTIEIPGLNEETLGALFYLFEVATAFSGYLYEINPFDQPGVEEGKKFTWGMMGRPGFEEKRETFARRPEKRDIYIMGTHIKS